MENLIRIAVEDLRKRWGKGANVYWNENAIVVIANNGYVSGFTLGGATIHTGVISTK